MRFMLLMSVISFLFIALVSIWIYTAIYDHLEQRKKNDSLHIRVADELLSRIDDERPIVLSVRQDKIIERVADEIEMRQSDRRIRGD